MEEFTQENTVIFFQTKSYDFSFHHSNYDLELTKISFDQFPKISQTVRAEVILYVHSKRNMGNTPTIKSLDELIIKAISAIPKGQKRAGEIGIYDSIKIFLENCDIDDSLLWERMKYLEKSKVIYNKSTKNGNWFYISKRDREIVSSPIDQTPVTNSTSNFESTPKAS